MQRREPVERLVTHQARGQPRRRHGRQHFGVSGERAYRDKAHARALYARLRQRGFGQKNLDGLFVALDIAMIGRSQHTLGRVQQN